MKARELNRKTNNNQKAAKPLILTAKASQNLQARTSRGCCGK